MAEKPRARHERAFVGCRKCGGLPSAARRRDVSLRLQCAILSTPPSAPLSPLTDRRPKPRQTARKLLVYPRVI